MQNNEVEMSVIPKGNTQFKKTIFDNNPYPVLPPIKQSEDKSSDALEKATQLADDSKALKDELKNALANNSYRKLQPEAPSLEQVVVPLPQPPVVAPANPLESPASSAKPAKEPAPAQTPASAKPDTKPPPVASPKPPKPDEKQQQSGWSKLTVGALILFPNLSAENSMKLLFVIGFIGSILMTIGLTTKNQSDDKKLKKTNKLSK